MESPKTTLDMKRVYDFLADAEKQKQEEAQRQYITDRLAKDLLKKLTHHAEGIDMDIAIFLDDICADAPLSHIAKIYESEPKTVDKDPNDEPEAIQRLAHTLLAITDLAQSLYAPSPEPEQLRWSKKYLKLWVFEDWADYPKLRERLLEFVDTYIMCNEPQDNFDVYSPAEREEFHQQYAAYEVKLIKEHEAQQELIERIKQLRVFDTFLHRADFEILVNKLSHALVTNQPLPKEELVGYGLAAGMSEKRCNLLINRACAMHRKMS